MADCPHRWCSNDPTYKGLQAVRWKLRSAAPRERCFARSLGYPPRTASAPLRVVWHVRTGDVKTNMSYFRAFGETLSALADGRPLSIVFESQDELPSDVRASFSAAQFNTGSPLLDTICRFLTADVLIMTGSSFPAMIAAFAPPWMPVVLEGRRKNRGRYDPHHAHHYFTAEEALLVEDGELLAPFEEARDVFRAMLPPEQS